MAKGPAGQRLAGEPTLTLSGRGLHLRATARHDRGGRACLSLPRAAPARPTQRPTRCRGRAGHVHPWHGQARRPACSRPHVSAQMSPRGRPQLHPRERDQGCPTPAWPGARPRPAVRTVPPCRKPASPGGPIRRPRSLHGNRDRSPCWDRSPPGEPRVGPGATSSVPPATDGESRHGAVACPALDSGPVQRCGWLCTPGSGLRCPPSPSRPCRLGKGPPPIPEPLPWAGLAQVLGAGTRNTRSLGSTRGPNHRHQEGLLFEESAGGRKLVRGRAGPSRSEGLKGVMGSRQP